MGKNPFRVHLTQHHRVLRGHSQKRNDKPPYKQRTCTNNNTIFQTDDIPESKHCCRRINRKQHFCFLSNSLSQWHHSRGKRFAPCPKRSDCKIVQSAYGCCPNKRFCLRSSFFSRNKHLSCRGSLRKRIFTVHIADKIFPKRD